ncbi:hypothetical protein BRADI_4g19105v3 [Brachypodium distachyon]|uniref:Uncharacterized protein n=1 Tax=Brachypodium distachyon TaxID=15368 RepID=A0A2K2CNP8_BRADI|nr:hypothetical protein BRADI_4g19105v3 [Brachypodium distachyon]
MTDDAKKWRRMAIEARHPTRKGVMALWLAGGKWRRRVLVVHLLRILFMLPHRPCVSYIGKGFGRRQWPGVQGCEKPVCPEGVWGVQLSTR